MAVEMKREAAEAMRVKHQSSPAAPTQVVLGGPEKGTLRNLGGSQNDVFNTAILNALAGTLQRASTEEDRVAQYTAAVIAMRAFQPTDEIEAMIAAQAVAMHHASMECSRRAMIPEQPYEITQGLRKAAANASRTFTDLLSALDRKRGKGGQQKVTVEHVHVHAGGQAVVGNVAPYATGGGGGDRGKSSGEPQALDRLAHEPAAGPIRPPLRRQDKERELMPATSNAERPVPHARRSQHRPPDGRGRRAHPPGPHEAWSPLG